jgi:hypothetical protein
VGGRNPRGRAIDRKRKRRRIAYAQRQVPTRVNVTPFSGSKELGEDRLAVDGRLNPARASRHN